MEIDEEMRRKIAVSVAVVAFFVAAVLYIGAQFDHGGLSQTGGYALVGAIGIFVLLMGAAGGYLARSS